MWMKGDRDVALFRSPFQAVCVSLPLNCCVWRLQPRCCRTPASHGAALDPSQPRRRRGHGDSGAGTPPVAESGGMKQPRVGLTAEAWAVLALRDSKGGEAKQRWEHARVPLSTRGVCNVLGREMGQWGQQQWELVTSSWLQGPSVTAYVTSCFPQGVSGGCHQLVGCPERWLGLWGGTGRG